MQKIQNAQERGEKEMKGIALGLCQWKDEHLWYGEKIWIPEDEGLRTTIISQYHDSSLAGHGGTAKTYRTGQLTILLAKNERNN